MRRGCFDIIRRTWKVQQSHWSSTVRLKFYVYRLETQSQLPLSASALVGGTIGYHAPCTDSFCSILQEAVVAANADSQANVAIARHVTPQRRRSARKRYLRMRRDMRIAIWADPFRLRPPRLYRHHPKCRRDEQRIARHEPRMSADPGGRAARRERGLATE